MSYSLLTCQLLLSAQHSKLRRKEHHGNLLRCTVCFPARAPQLGAGPVSVVAHGQHGLVRDDAPQPARPAHDPARARFWSQLAVPTEQEKQSDRPPCTFRYECARRAARERLHDNPACRRPGSRMHGRRLQTRSRSRHRCDLSALHRRSACEQTHAGQVADAPRELAVTRTRSGASSRANEHYRGCAVAAVAATQPYPILAAACLTLGRPGRGGARRASGRAGAPRRADAGARAGRRTRAPPSACGRSGCWARRPPRSRRKSAHTAPCARARLRPCGRTADPHCVMHSARSQWHAH
jgi:hypothetical protein